MDIADISERLCASPQAFPLCCLAISSTLITHLGSLLPKKPELTLSVGSGSGLLEALIVHRHPSISIQGVEVNSSVNIYLAEQDINVVSGTWSVYPGARAARAWLFVYPREPKLVSKYLDAYGDQTVDLIVWLGPQADWIDYQPCFRNSNFSERQLSHDPGLMPYESLVVLTRAGSYN